MDAFTFDCPPFWTGIEHGSVNNVQSKDMITNRSHEPVSNGVKTNDKSKPSETRLKPTLRVNQSKSDIWSMVNAAAAASTFEAVINMGMGYFGFDPPQYILDAAIDAIRTTECNQYAPTLGRARLRKALATAYSRSLESPLDWNTDIAITSGANEGILSIFMAFLNPGDEVIVFEPIFNQHVDAIEMAGGTVKRVALSPPAQVSGVRGQRSSWEIDWHVLSAAFNNHTKAILVNSPHNPTGKVLSRRETELIAALATYHDVLVICDDVYDSMRYVPSVNIMTLSPDLLQRTFIVGSTGKTFYATGWRIGWVIGHAEKLKYVSAAHSRMCYTSPSPFQEATAVAFEKADEMNFWFTTKARMHAKVLRFLEILDAVGLHYTIPQGGYFVLVDCGSIRIPEDSGMPDGLKSCSRDLQINWFLINKIGISAIPLSAFYSERNTGWPDTYLRFAVGIDDDVIDAVGNRLRAIIPYLANT